MTEAPIKLRPARTEDEAFILRLYESTRAAELALVPWEAAQREMFVRLQSVAQRAHYQSEYPTAEQLLILLDGEPAGRLYVHRREAEIRLLDFSLLPEYHTHAAGPQLIRSLMDEAASADKAVTIHLQPGDALQGLFDQLGFKCATDNGVHALFEWRAGA
jgi:hypothetical protein